LCPVATHCLYRSPFYIPTHLGTSTHIYHTRTHDRYHTFIHFVLTPTYPLPHTSFCDVHVSRTRTFSCVLPWIFGFTPALAFYMGVTFTRFVLRLRYRDHTYHACDLTRIFHTDFASEYCVIVWNTVRTFTLITGSCAPFAAAVTYAHTHHTRVTFCHTVYARTHLFSRESFSFYTTFVCGTTRGSFCCVWIFDHIFAVYTFTRALHRTAFGIMPAMDVAAHRLNTWFHAHLPLRHIHLQTIVLHGCAHSQSYVYALRTSPLVAVACCRVYTAPFT